MSLPRPSHTLVSICAIAIMAVFAVSNGIDGNVVYLAIVAVAGLGGYEVRELSKTG